MARQMSGVPVWVEANTEWRVHVEEAARSGGGELVRRPEEARAIVWAADEPRRLQALLHSGIEWVQLSAAGIEDWFAAGVIDDARCWTAAKGVYAGPIAEYTIAMLLAGARRLQEVTRTPHWRPLEVGMLGGKTVAIIGAGGIGTAVIELLRPLGCRVLAVTRTGRTLEGVDLSVSVDEFDRVVPQADFLVLAAPDTAATRGLFDRERLARIRRDAWLVNVGRGTIIDTDALVEALRERRIGGVALDVTDPEPLPDGHPLWSLPNAIVTSHTACTPALGRGAYVARVRENVRRFVSGEPLLGVVDMRNEY
jgi:phosphoglycerate dehydrogenase-like enzyme